MLTCLAPSFSSVVCVCVFRQAARECGEGASHRRASRVASSRGKVQFEGPLSVEHASRSTRARLSLGESPRAPRQRLPALTGQDPRDGAGKRGACAPIPVLPAGLIANLCTVMWPAGRNDPRSRDCGEGRSCQLNGAYSWADTPHLSLRFPPFPLPLSLAPRGGKRVRVYLMYTNRIGCTISL